MLFKKNKLVSLLIFCSVLLSSNLQAALNVFACEPEWAALAKALGGDKLTVYAATTALQDPHHIQARPSLIAKARSADLVVCSGADLEVGWLPLLLRKASNASIHPGKPGYFMASHFVEKFDVPEKLDRRMGDVHAEGNPHVHTNPENILTISRELLLRLNQIDADNAVYYSQRHQQFAEQWQQKIIKWKQQVAVLKGSNVVTHHKYWTYLTRWLGINVIATLEPVPGVSPSSGHLARLKKQLAAQATSKEKPVEMVLYVSYANDRPAKWLAQQSGLTAVALPATVDFQAGESLTQWFDGIINKLLSVQ